MTWESVDIIADSYSVMVTPTPADDHSERTTQLPVTTLGLYENVEYKVTISPGTYSIGLNKTFTIGKFNNCFKLSLTKLSPCCFRSLWLHK